MISEENILQLTQDDVDCSEATIERRHDLGLPWQVNCLMFGTTCVVITGCTEEDEPVYAAAEF